MTLSRRLRRVARIAVPIVAAGALLGSLQIAPAIASPVTAKPTVPAGCPWMNTNESATSERTNCWPRARWTRSCAGSTSRRPIRRPSPPSVARTARDLPGPGRLHADRRLLGWAGLRARHRRSHGVPDADRTRVELQHRPRVRRRASRRVTRPSARGKNVLLGPGVSSSRTPLGRPHPRVLGEDSLLSGDLAAADINGIQTGNPDEPVMAVRQALHRQRAGTRPPDQLVEHRRTHPPRGRTTCRSRSPLSKGDPGGVMCSYNQVNGVYACENPILNNLLKGDTGFDGYVVVGLRRRALDRAVAQRGTRPGAQRARSSTRPRTSTRLSTTAPSPWPQIDAAAFRVVRAYIQAGLFDHPLPATPHDSTPSTAANKAVAQQIAEQGSVLLQNTDGDPAA